MKMLEALPIELQEKICSFLDGATLLRATCVSTQWNRIISGLQMVWRQASLREGFGTPVKDWKLHYVTCVRLLQRLKKGKAFQHRHFAPKCFQCSDVRDVVFWNGCILAGIKKCIRVWRVEDLKPAAVFDVPYEIFCLSVSFNNHVLGVGHYDGAITTWLLDEVEVRASLLQCYVGHRDNVVCLCVAPELNLMCSGSRDRTIKLWCLGSGQLLETLTASGWVSQVTLLPAGSHNSPYELRNSLLAADQSSIRLYSWPVQHGSAYGDIDTIEASDLSIAVDKEVSLRKFLLQEKHIMYVQDGMIVVLDLVSCAQIKCFRTEYRDVVLLASGARYVLVTMWESCLKNSKLAVFNIADGELVGTYPMPFCREYVVAGDVEWLNGVSGQRPNCLVAAGWMMGVLHMDQLTDVLHLITWLPDHL
ncbi:hypothetical protein B7P43_G12602 [Cryptotermes secundus]|uniref:F-box domain-containing protein n=1 Tax=Cryptotermes secundus TaxID=105785 RepID=A0A2J7QKM1_9NEOP|nr:F-box/WD repeat-containing protein 2 isoform X2 [Cryptotermes secundus]PNF29135.1 hypothetical protein B7P43_G12602 [Cryptotermes secundus]